MSSSLHRTGTLLGLVLVLWGGLSWGQLPPTNDTSDAARNTGGGTSAFINNTPNADLTMGADNTAYGFEALTSNTTGSLNTAYGAFALHSHTGGHSNTAIGVNALFSNNGFNNTAIGVNALINNTMGHSNTASGVNTLFSNTMGADNTAAGWNALQQNITGFSNTASGVFALRSNTTGGLNTAYGSSALQWNTGSRNTATGADALFRNTTGNDNIAIGVQAGVNLTDGSVNIYLGHPGGGATESDTMRLGEAQTRTFIAGVAGVQMSGSNSSPVYISSTGQLGIKQSSARYKHDIEPLGAHSQGLVQLRPVTFRYRQDPQGARQYGLIAEEVATVYPELVIRGATGEVESVQYEALIPLLLHALQHQQAQVAELRAQNAALAARLERLEAAAARAATLTSR